MTSEQREQWLTIVELSKELQIPVKTLYSWRYRGDEGPQSVKIGRHVRYRRRDVDAWLERLTAAERPAA